MRGCTGAVPAWIHTCLFPFERLLRILNIPVNHDPFLARHTVEISLIMGLTQ